MSRLNCLLESCASAASLALSRNIPANLCSLKNWPSRVFTSHACRGGKPEENRGSSHSQSQSAHVRAGDSGTWEAPGPAVDCLIAAVSAAPAAFRSHLKPLEDYAASALVEHSSSIPARQRAAHLLSLLPSITGEPLRCCSEAWCDLIQEDTFSWQSVALGV